MCTITSQYFWIVQAPGSTCFQKSMFILPIHENNHFKKVLGLMNGAEGGFVVVYFLVISLQNDVKEVFVVLTALMKSHPISSPAAVIFERKNNECTSPLYSKKHVFLIHAILYTSHVKGPANGNC